MRISKSKFVAGVQCLKRLYYQVHEPESAEELSVGARARIEQGHEVGLLARALFPAGVAVGGSPADFEESLRSTRDLLANSKVPAIFEATVTVGGAFIRADVLENCGSSRFRLLEVKSSNELKPHYLYDVALQKYILEQAGIALESVAIIHLNPGYAFNGLRYELDKLFLIQEIREPEAIDASEISGRLREQFYILNQSQPPAIKAGKHCSKPHLCEFYARCNPEVLPDHPSLIPRLSARKERLLEEAGITSMKDIPESFDLTEPQRRVVDCVKSGEISVSPKFQSALDSLKYPLCFMDFETFAPAIPWFSGMSPHNPIPFQWSVHRQEHRYDELQHFEFIAGDRSDPREDFIQGLTRVLAGAGNIVVFSKTFEHSRLSDLQRWLPEYALKIQMIKDKMWDLLVAIRAHVYHPKFRGSYSLKDVLPAFLPELSYDQLEISEGISAGLAWTEMISTETPVAEKDKIKTDLLAYCRQDTLALARLLEVLGRYL